MIKEKVKPYSRQQTQTDRYVLIGLSIYFTQGRKDMNSEVRIWHVVSVWNVL